MKKLRKIKRLFMEFIHLLSDPFVGSSQFLVSLAGKSWHLKSF